MGRCVACLVLCAVMVSVASGEEVDLLTLGRGTTLLSATSDAPRAIDLIDGDLEGNGWHNRTPKDALPYEFVLELLAPTKLTSIGAKNAIARPGGVVGGAAKTIEVYGSAESPEAGFTALGTLAMAPDALEMLAINPPTSVRWLKFVITENQGSPQWTYLRELIAHGEQEEVPDDDGRFTGFYDANLGWIDLYQDGSALSGCYKGGTLKGSVTGGVARLTWADSKSAGVGGSALFVRNSRGNLSGVRYRLPGRALWGGPPAKPNGRSTCAPQKEENTIQQALEGDGAVVLYGINFDHDSAEILPKSGPALEALLKALQAAAALKVDIEGHTDSSGGDGYNLDLSKRRAASVVAWLAEHGIDGTRLNPVGVGEVRPIADNSTDDGRALNRRVEVHRR